MLRDLGIPFLVHGRTRTPEGYNWLDVDNTRAFARATELLLDLGHRNIALINGQDGFDFARRREAGYRTALQARGVPPNDKLIFGDVMTESYGHCTAAALLDGPEPPTAFLVASVLIAIGVRRAAQERGLHLGRELSLICHDDVLSYLNNDSGGLAFTATRSSIRLAGRRCAEILIDLIRDPDQPPVQEIWETELIVGRSTGPCPA